MSAETLALFTLASVLIELTPGPNMAWLAVVAAAEGRKPGFAAVGGVALGLGLVGLAAAFGLTAALTAYPPAYHALRWAGAAWLLWLAWDGWRGADEAIEARTDGWALRRYFRRGLVTNLLNPKAAAFFVTVVPGFVERPEAALADTLILSAIYVAVATLIHAAIVALAGFAAALLAVPSRARVIRRALAVALAGVALWFLWSTA